MRILSIDLAAVEKNNTGIAYFKGKEIISRTVKTNREILEIAEKGKFEVVGIDAPLSIPKGRKSIDDRNGNHFRECDLMLREKGYKFFPITLGGMRTLTKRGMLLKKKLEEKGKKVYEIFPGASIDALGLRRKNVEDVKEFVKKLGYKESIRNIDESDAVIGLITLKFLFEGKAEILKGEDGEIVVVKKL